MNLHAIIPANPTAAIWLYARGGNGRSITKMGHLWIATRGTPPPPGEEAPDWGGRWWRSQRQNWTPWRPPSYDAGREVLLTPLCGPLKSAARFPQLGTWGNWNQQNIRCPNCTTIARGRNLDITTITALRDQDPWLAIPTEERENVPDPVSGL